MRKFLCAAAACLFGANFLFSYSRFGSLCEFFEQNASGAEKGKSMSQCAVFADAFFSPQIAQKADFSATAIASWRYAFNFSSAKMLDEANARFSIEAELSTSCFAPRASVSITPLSFLTLTAGASGTVGWNYACVKGIASYDEFSDEFDGSNFRNSVFTQVFAGGELRLRSRWLTSNPWADFCLSACGEANFCNVSGLEDYEVYIVSSEEQKPRTNCADWTAAAKFLWNMPCVVSATGADFCASGLANSSPRHFGSYKMNFVFLDFGFFAVFKPADGHLIFVRAEFGNTRKFEDDSKKECEKSFDKMKWVFKKFGVSWLWII